MADSGGIKMGIQSALRGIMLLAGRNGCGEGVSTAITRTADVPTGVGTDRTEADEKFARASLVADEWDGTITLLSRRVSAPAE